MTRYPEPATREQALTLALVLALAASTGAKARQATDVAEALAAGLDASTVELCKAAALERFEALERDAVA